MLNISGAFLDFGKSSFGCIFHESVWLISKQQSCKVETIRITFQIEKPGFREMKSLAWGSTACKWWNLHPNLGSLKSKALCAWLSLVGVSLNEHGRWVIQVFWTRAVLFPKTCFFWSLGVFAVVTSAQPHPAPALPSRQRNKGNRKLNKLPKGHSLGVNEYLLYSSCLI